jgi:hypothetical protein
MGDSLQNECNVITIFPMVIECIGINPSLPTASDGQMTVSITGGTPPYTIIWSNGNISPAINNLSVGEYSATVIDYYGDFSAETTCTLSVEVDCTFSASVTNFIIEPTPTPTLTRTVTPTPTQTQQPTPTPTRTLNVTNTPTATRTLTPTRTLTQTPTLTKSSTLQPTPTPTPTIFTGPCECLRYQFVNPNYETSGPVTISYRDCYDSSLQTYTYSGYFLSLCICEGSAVAPSFIEITNKGVDNCQE